MRSNPVLIFIYNHSLNAILFGVYVSLSSWCCSRSDHSLEPTTNNTKVICVRCFENKYCHVTNIWKLVLHSFSFRILRAIILERKILILLIEMPDIYWCQYLYRVWTSLGVSLYNFVNMLPIKIISVT